MIAPVAAMVGAIFWGTDEAVSVAYALAIVVVNFLLAAWSLGFAAHISIALMAGVALFGFAIRLGLITLAVLSLRRRLGRLIPGLTLIITLLDCCSGNAFRVRLASLSGLKPKSGLDAAHRQQRSRPLRNQGAR